MNAELWVLLVKTGGTTAAIFVPLAWLFRKGGVVTVKVRFGGPHGGPGGAGKGGGES